MFTTLHYFWINYWQTVKRGRPSKRMFILFLKFLWLEVKCLWQTGHTTDEIDKM